MNKIIHKRAVSLVLALAITLGYTFNYGMINYAATKSGNVSDSGSTEEAKDSGVVDTGFRLRAVSASSSWDAAKKFNLVCFQDYINNGDDGSDVCGSSFIGKSIDVCNFTFGVPANGPGHTLKAGDYGLVFGATEPGNFKLTGYGSSNCSALVYNKAIADDTKYTFSKYSYWNDNATLRSKLGIDLEISDLELNGNKVSNFQKDLIEKSEELAEFSKNGSWSEIAYTNHLKLAGNHAINIFEISADDLKNCEGILLDTKPEATDIINVICPEGDHSVVIPPVFYKNDGSNLNGQNGGDGQKKLSHLLWNLPCATELSNLGSNSIKGSVLAPRATVSAEGRSNYEGTMIVNSFETGTVGLEGHDYPFQGDLPVNTPPDLKKSAHVRSWNDRTYDITLNASSSDEIEQTKNTITDVVDSRFNVLDDNGSVITDQNQTVALGNGGKVSYDKSLKAWKVVWISEIPPQKNDGSYGWTQSFTIKAKGDFIGGNNIATNVSEYSGVIYDQKKDPDLFPEKPVVNVRPVFAVNNAEITIFLGEKSPKSKADSCVSWNGDEVSYQWFQKIDDSKLEPLSAENTGFPDTLYPQADVIYVLKASFDPGSPTDESNDNTDGFKAGEKAEGSDNWIVQAQGTYTVHVKSGTLVIKKKITNIASDPGRSFVFLVSGTAPAGCKVITPFYVTLTMTDSNTLAEKTITGLSKGVYSVKEVNSNWQYDNGAVTIVPEDAKLGYQLNDSKDDFTDKQLQAVCSNKFSHNQWFSATDSVTNTFKK